TRLADLGADLISETIRDLKDIEPKPQANNKASFAPILKREDGLIDWSMDAFAIERRVRGFQPWPNAYTTLNSKRLIVWQAMPEKTALSRSQSGSVVEASGDYIRVMSG